MIKICRTKKYIFIILYNHFVLFTTNSPGVVTLLPRPGGAGPLLTHHPPGGAGHILPNTSRSW